MTLRKLTSAAALTAAMALAAASPLQKPTAGTIDRLSFWSPQMGDSVTVDVWRPDAAGPLPVIYMHDGQNLFDATTTWNGQAWEVDSILGAMISKGEAAPAMVVGVHSNSSTRVADLMPQKAVAGHGMEETLKSAGQGGAPVRGDAYAAFLVETLKPAIDSLYATVPDRPHTTVMGSSMGGLMSIYALCEYPDIFGNAICLSTHWVGRPEVADQFSGAMERYLREHLPAPGNHRLYFDHGTTTIDAWYGPAEERITDMIRRKGYDEASMLQLTFPGAAHTERDWAARLHIPLTFLLGR